MSADQSTTSNDARSSEQPTSTDNTMSSDIPSAVMALHIKSLEQQTKPVTIPRDASVLDLKQAVQTAFQVESTRQRLIFQGKVLKDEKNLTDYANLDNGKVVHLVVRPADVPQNTQNDEPRPQSSNTNRRTFARGIPFSRLFPLGGRQPAMEGYTFITLDVGDPGHHLSSLMDGLAGNLFPSPNLGTPPRPATGAENTNGNNSRSSTPQTSNRNATRTRDPSTSTGSSPSIPSSRSPFEFTLGPRSASDLGPTTPSDIRSATGVPFPPSVEVRLMRTMSCMRNVRTILDTPPDQNLHGITNASSTSPEQNQEIRSRLRSSGNSQTAAVGMVLDELATLMTDVVPRLREMSEALRAGDRTPNTEENVHLYRRVLRTARVVQGMSLINHFLGSVLAAADISPSRRSRPRTSGSGSTSTSSSPRANSTSTSTQSESNGTNASTSTSNKIKTEGQNSKASSSSTATATAAAAAAAAAAADTTATTTTATTDKEDESTRGIKRKLEEPSDSPSSTPSQQDKGKRRDTGGDS
ncbi:hypothetical protein BDA99DRAFT_506334 [Phascolomyces articulosus]|uniref:Ubiquitin-like domain-containing protein n=1 Tax=Phascolomyces articulosus TaxID=60185 RepID=A0AAD5PFJ7_9FUNG|nr:hypothetical protein BDA99DRAFT_506334 [Phascolomyces articulosus]